MRRIFKLKNVIKISFFRNKEIKKEQLVKTSCSAFGYEGKSETVYILLTEYWVLFRS